MSLSKKIIYGVIIIVALGFNSSAHAQMNYWTTPPFKFNMNPATPTATAIPGYANSPYKVANGAYDQNGNLLFTVQDGYIYGPTGTYAGKLGGYNMSVCGDQFDITRSEVSIVPIPGSCNQFYVIYVKECPIAQSVLLYVKVDCSGTNPVVINSQNVSVMCPPEQIAHMEPEGFIINLDGSYDMTAFAVSKVYIGSGSTAKRFIFSTSASGIYRSLISSTGITGPTLIATYSALGLTSGSFESYEAELSRGSNMFAWVDAAGGSKALAKVHVIGINPSTGLWDYTVQHYSIAGATGIEFNSEALYPKLYVSRTGGVSKINTQTRVVTSVTLPSGVDLSNTFLEYAKNNKIYGISPTFDPENNLISTTLVGISSTDVISQLNAGFDSRNRALNNIFTLPDQVDGDNYNQFIGNPIVSLAGFTINNITPSGNCTTLTNFFNCNPITFSATYTGGTPTKYKLVIKSTDINCQMITGQGYINYNPTGAWALGQPPTNLDLRTLTDGAQLNLSTTPGRVNIAYTIRDACDHESTLNYTIMVSSAPQANIALEIYNSANPQTYLAPSHSISTPVPVGTYSLGYRISNSTGVITFYRAVIDEIASNGTATNIYDRYLPINGVSGLTYENLNSYCVSAAVWPVNPGFGECNTGLPDHDGSTSTSGYNGYTGYFGYNNGAYSYHRTFKLTVYIGNECLTVSDYSYLYVTTRNKSAVDGVGNEILNNNVSIGNNLIVFPNPTSDFVSFMITNQIEESYSLVLTDMYGKRVKLLLDNESISAGTSKRTFSITDLPSGIYLYQLKSKSVNCNGLITKN